VLLPLLLPFHACHRQGVRTSSDQMSYRAN
jgi:hypothetical protein